MIWMKTPHVFALALAIAGSWLSVVSAECLDPARKPIKLSGTICGNATIAILYEPYDGDVFVYRGDLPFSKDGVTTVTADAKGNFKFGPLAKGSYLLGVPGFNSTYPAIEVTKSTKTCGRQLYVVANLGGDCRSYITTKKPRPD